MQSVRMYASCVGPVHSSRFRAPSLGPWLCTVENPSCNLLASAVGLTPVARGVAAHAHDPDGSTHRTSGRTPHTTPRTPHPGGLAHVRPCASSCPPSRATANASELVGSRSSSVAPPTPTPVGTTRLRTMQAPMPPWPLSTSRLPRRDVGLRVMLAAVTIRAARDSSQLLLLLSSAAPHRQRSGV